MVSSRAYRIGDFDTGSIYYFIQRKGKGKGKGPVLDITLLLDEHMLELFTISEVAADWHELMISQRITRPPIARASEQLDLRCSVQAHQHSNQLH